MDNAREIITEMLSISKGVEMVANQIYDNIEKDYCNHPHEKDREGLFFSQWVATTTIWEVRLKMVITVYDFTIQEVFDSIAHRIKCYNEFNETNCILNVTAIMYNGFIYKPLTETAIYHEIEHFYQYCQGKRNNAQFSSLSDGAYNRALAVIDKKQMDLTNDIALVLYYSNPREQDAFAHEYYAQARQSAIDFLNNTTDVENRFKWYRDKVNWLNTNINDPKVVGIISQYSNYGFNPKNFLTYANKGVNRFKNKLNHVRALVSPMYHTRVDYNETTHPIKKET